MFELLYLILSIQRSNHSIDFSMSSAVGKTKLSPSLTCIGQTLHSIRFLIASSANLESVKFKETLLINRSATKVM